MKNVGRRRMRARIAAAIAGAVIAMLGGCAGSNSPYDRATWFDLGKPNLTSFLGVRFGSSINRVREELPDGDFETSPYGANAWKVDNLESGGVLYRKVVFEFTDNMGMQLAVAEFAPEAGAAVLSQLKRALGEPVALRSSAGAAGSGVDSLVASWDLPHDERVTFNGPAQQVEMLGPAGSPLRHDLALRRAEDNGTE
jgi:hypothetical protein